MDISLQSVCPSYVAHAFLLLPSYPRPFFSALQVCRTHLTISLPPLLSRPCQDSTAGSCILFSRHLRAAVKQVPCLPLPLFVRTLQRGGEW